MKLNLFIPFVKINSKWIMDTNIRAQITKLFDDHRLGNSFLAMPSKA
jgi:hypothetical protein